MNRKSFLPVIAVLFLSSCQVPPSGESSRPDQKAYAWLLQHQSPTGLVGGQEDDDFSGIYANALAACCFLHEGDTARAEKIFDFYQAHLDGAFTESKPNGFHQFCNARTGEIHTDTDRWLGDNAWLLIALNYYRRETGRTDYDVMRDKIARWIITLQDKDGGICSGYTKNGFNDAKSTEGNLDCYAALVDFPDERNKVKEWLVTQMWLPDEGRFMMGSTVSETPLDSIAWGICSLGKEFAKAMPYAEKTFLRTSVSDLTHKPVHAFADAVNKDRIWFEGSGQMCVAYEVIGESEKAAMYIRELELAMVESPRFPGTIGNPFSTTDPLWKGGSEKIFVPSQAWYLFAKWNFNPMAPQ